MDKEAYDPQDDEDGGQAWFVQVQQAEQLCCEQQYRLVINHTERKTNMGLIARDKAVESSYEIAPAGAFAARCYRVIDLGTQTFNVKGETKRAHQCVITWEISKNMENGKPFQISEKYTVSLNDKARLCLMLESWRGKKFTEVEKQGFNCRELVGKVCFLNIVHTTKNDRTYANVASVMAMPEGLPSPKMVNEIHIFDLDNYSVADFEKTPKYYQELIRKSPEFQQLDAVGSNPGASDQDDEDIPF